MRWGLLKPLSFLLPVSPVFFLFDLNSLLNLTSSFALAFGWVRLSRRLTDARESEPWPWQRLRLWDFGPLGRMRSLSW